MKILVVEDNRCMADEIAENLRDHGMDVEVAYDGFTATAKLGNFPYDVVVLDRDIPGLHDVTLCRIITSGEDPAMVMMLTAAEQATERITGLGLGVDDYLPKPVKYAELARRIHSLAKRRAGTHPATLRSGRIELDPLLGTVYRDGRRCDLSPKEFALLEALIRAGSTPISAECLLESVWGHDGDPLLKTVTVAIGRLRRKLGPPQAIETIVGVGYRIQQLAE